MTGRMVVRRSLTRLTLWILALGWVSAAATVQAAQSAPDMVADMPWVQIALGAWIAAWGGGAATLTRYLAAVYEERPFLTRVEIAKDVFVSGIVGSATYLTGAIYEWPPMVIGLALLLAGWLGVRLLNVVADRALAAVMTGGPKP